MCVERACLLLCPLYLLCGVCVNVCCVSGVVKDSVLSLGVV